MRARQVMQARNACDCIFFFVFVVCSPQLHTHTNTQQVSRQVSVFTVNVSMSYLDVFDESYVSCNNPSVHWNNYF